MVWSATRSLIGELVAITAAVAAIVWPWSVVTVTPLPFSATSLTHRVGIKPAAALDDLLGEAAQIAQRMERGLIAVAQASGVLAGP